MKGDDIIVSVEMLSYNHEDTIARAIESVISQKTKYRYELIIGDDASTDSSQRIIKEYYEKYPDIIVPICREKNIGAGLNGRDIERKARGKYLAICEGDDYWIDNNKLENQVTFLEENSEYSACYTKCKMMLDGDEQNYPFADSDSLNMEDMLNNGEVKRYATCTLVFRNLYKQNPELLGFFKDCYVGDIIMQTIFAKYGKIHYIDNETSVYNRNSRSGESFSAMSLNRQVMDIKKAIDICKNISDNEYDQLWNSYMTGFFVEAFWKIYQEDGKIQALRWLMKNEKQVRKSTIDMLKKNYFLAKQH